MGSACDFFYLSPQEPSVTSFLHLENNQSNVSSPTVARTSCSASKSSKSNLSPPVSAASATPPVSDGEKDDWKDNLYFNCVYAKPSTRKHKKWEGDGVLIVKGKSVTLKVGVLASMNRRLARVSIWLIRRTVPLSVSSFRFPPLILVKMGDFLIRSCLRLGRIQRANSWHRRR